MTYLALAVHWYNAADCIDWAESALTHRPDDSDLILLYGCARAQSEEVRRLLNVLMMSLCPKFDPEDADGRATGLRVMKQACEAYIKKEITPD